MTAREKMRDFVPLAGYKINMFVPFHVLNDVFVLFQIQTAIFVLDHVKIDGFVPFYV